MRAGSDFSFCPICSIPSGRPSTPPHIVCQTRASIRHFIFPLSLLPPAFVLPSLLLLRNVKLSPQSMASAVSDNLTAVAAAAAGHNNGSVRVASVSLCQGGPMLSLSLFQPFFPLPDNIQYQLQLRTKPLLPLKSARQRRVNADQTEHFYPLYSDHLRLGTLKLL